MRRFWMAAVGLAAALIGILLTGADPVGAAPSGRPVLPDERTHGSEHFLIHFTLSGHQAVDAADGDGSGVPDYVELVADTLEHVYVTEVDTMGWPPPAPDGGQGGDERIDVYLDEILSDGYAGYVETEEGFIGDNPLTPQQERRAAYVFMVLDDDFAEVDPDSGESPTALMQATAAHEFNHALQAGIDDRDPHFWLYEASATWMEDEVYDSVNDGIYYLDSVFKNPDICLVAEVARGDDLHWYGTWLLMRLMSERYGPEVVRSIWDNMRQFSGFGAIDAALAGYGSSLELESRDFSVANLLRAYEEGAEYPTVRIEGEAGIGQYVPPDGVQSLGADYIHLTGGGVVVVGVSQSDVPLTLRAVGVRGGEADVIDASGGAMHIDLDAYQDVFLVVHDDEQIALEEDCVFRGYTLDIQTSTALQSPVAATWPTANYVTAYDTNISPSSGGVGTYRPPDVPFADSEDEVATEPENLNVGYDVLIPAHTPAGYTFDYAYIMTAAEFGDSAPYYVPGGGDTANFDYLDQSGNWLSIAESPTPYATVQDWLVGVDYLETPGEIRSIKGVDVLVEDLTSGSDVWFSATLILDDLFIVVDGDYREADVIALVEGLIDAAQGEVAPTPAVVATPTPPAPTPAGTPPTPLPLPSPQPAASGPFAALGAVTIVCGAAACVGLSLLLVAGIWFLSNRRRNR
jgi:hypothetical protein